MARSVDCPIDFMCDQSLTCFCKPGFGQAEVSDTSRLQMGGDCQAEQIRAEQDTTFASKATLGLPEGKESSRRLERLGRGMEEEEKLENETMQKKDLWEAWRNLRKLKKELLEKETNWQVLNTKESWKIKAEGRKLRVEVAHSKKKRFGKICKKGLTDLEDKLLKSQTLSLLDLK